MKIGILTFHAAHNYGAVLQCYALQTFLEELGHNVSVIDYRRSDMLAGYKVFFWRRWIARNPVEMVKRIWRELHLLKVRRQRFCYFNDFINNRLHLQPVCTITSNPYDYILIGSDQVWNTSITYGLDQYYWGQFPHPCSTKIASYAASMQDKWEPKDEENICKYISSMEKISVRENTLAEALQRLMPAKTICNVVDPTLLLKEKQWDIIAISPKLQFRYVLLYQVEAEPKTQNIANSVATELGLPLITLSSTIKHHNSRSLSNASPGEFVGFFKHAFFVVCSSFHGTAFSIIYHKPFYSIRLFNGKDKRVESLLHEFGLESHFIDEYKPCDAKKIIGSCDYNYNNSTIISESHKFLNSL